MTFIRKNNRDSRGRDNKRPGSPSRFYHGDIRLIGDDGKVVGDMPYAEASRIAKERELDLVEVNAHVNPPIFKIMDYGKYKYSLQKEESLKRKTQKITAIKIIQMRQGIGEADYQTKLKKAREFIKDGDKIKCTVRLQGREMINRGLAINLLTKVGKDLQDCAKVEKDVVQNNNNFFIILTPDAKQ